MKYFQDQTAEMMTVGIKGSPTGSEEKYGLLYNYQAFILKLTDSLRPLTDAIEIQNTAAKAVGELMKVGRAFYFEAEQDVTGYIHVIKKDYHNQPGMVSMVGRHPNSAFGEFLLDNLVQGSTLTIEDVEQVPQLTAADKASYRRIDCRAFMAVPLVKDGQYKGGFAVLDTVPRVWTLSEAAVLEEVVERTWAAVERGRAEEALRKNEQRLGQLLKLRDEFIGIASHELKTPLTSIKAYGQLLERHFSETVDDPYAGMMKKLNLQVDRLIGLISNMLDITRMDEGKLVLEFSGFDLNQLIDERVEDLQRITSAHTIKVYTETIPTVMADRERIGQVITNLLSNAIKYSPDGGEIIVSSGLQNGFVRVSVKDNGIGIPAALQEKIFDRFFRVESKEMRGISGMGIGLFICQEIIHRHGGRLTVDSEMGEGATFSFFIPVSL